MNQVRELVQGGLFGIVGMRHQEMRGCREGCPSGQQAACGEIFEDFHLQEKHSKVNEAARF